MNKDKVKTMLRVCIDPMCGRDDCNKQCEYHDYVCCQDYLCRDALAVIEEQEKEIERQNSRIKALNNRLNEKYALISNMETDYNRAFERLKAQQREIDKLKAEKEKRLTCDFVKTAQKHAKIDVLNELKEMLDSKPDGWSYTIYIDEIIKDIENGKDKG